MAKENNSWTLGNDAMLYSSLSAAILCGIIAKFIGFQLWASIVIALAIFGGMCAYNWPNQKMLVKTFPTSKPDAHGIIRNVLQEKGLPYKFRQKFFDLVATNVRIEMKVVYSREYRPIGTSVSIGPVTDGNLLFIESLQQNIDEAFKPRGLP